MGLRERKRMAEGFGKYDVYAVSGSIYCYKDSSVLRNRFGIRDSGALKEVESDFSAVKQQELLSQPIRGRFTTHHLCQIHKYLLGDIYSFAGHFRREDIMKGSTRFMSHRDIKLKTKQLLDELKTEQYLRSYEQSEFIKRSAYYLSELNYIHPFREGNGRAIREFMRLLLEYNGYSINWNAVSSERMLSAMEESVFDTAMLVSVLGICVKNCS